MKAWFLMIAAIGAIGLQVIFFPHLRLFGVKPDLILVLAAFTGLLRGSNAGGFIGFFGGLLEDLVAGRAIGINAISQMVTGYAAGFGKGRLFEDNLIAPLGLVLVATLLREAIYFVMAWSFGFGFSSAFIIRGVIIPTAFYNVLVGALIYGHLARLEGRLKGGGARFLYALRM